MDAMRRSGSDRVFAGVCGGLARYFGVDSALVRLAFVVIAFAGGLGFLVYLALMLLMRGPSGADELPPPPLEPDAARKRELAGYALVIVGGVWFLSAIGAFSAIPWQFLWPIALIAAGVLLLLQVRR